MANSMLVKWTDEGKHKNCCDHVERRFILDEGELKVGRKVRAKFTSKKNSRAKVWNGIIVEESAVGEEQVVKKKKPTRSVDKPKQTVSITIYNHIYVYTILSSIRNLTMMTLSFVLDHLHPLSSTLLIQLLLSPHHLLLYVIV